MAETGDVAATSRFYVFFLGAAALASLGCLILMAVTGYGTVGVLLFAGFCVVLSWALYKTCYRIEVTDGYLVMHYLFRRRGVPLDHVSQIHLVEDDEGVPKFKVTLRDGTKFRVAANTSTRRMMAAILRRQPGVAVIGDIGPELR